MQLNQCLQTFFDIGCLSEAVIDSALFPLNFPENKSQKLIYKIIV